MPATRVVLSRSAIDTKNALSMWGKLYVDATNGATIGWLVDTWSLDTGVQALHPKMHWVPKEDGKFHHVRFDIGYQHSTLELHGEDTDIEPQRAAFIRKTLAAWEKELTP